MANLSNTYPTPAGIKLLAQHQAALDDVLIHKDSWQGSIKKDLWHNTLKPVHDTARALWGLDGDGEDFWQGLSAYYTDVFGCPNALQLVNFLKQKILFDDQPRFHRPCLVGLLPKPLDLEAVARSYFKEPLFLKIWPQLHINLLPEQTRSFSQVNPNGSSILATPTDHTCDPRMGGEWIHECAHIKQLWLAQWAEVPLKKIPIYNREYYALSEEFRFLKSYPRALKAWQKAYGVGNLNIFMQERWSQGSLWSKTLATDETLSHELSLPFLSGIYVYLSYHIQMQLGGIT